MYSRTFNVLFSFAAWSCSSFSKVSCLSALRSSPKTLTFSLTVLVSSMVEMRYFLNLEFSASKASTLDPTDLTFASWLKYSKYLKRRSNF